MTESGHAAVTETLPPLRNGWARVVYHDGRIEDVNVQEPAVQVAFEVAWDTSLADDTIRRVSHMYWFCWKATDQAARRHNRQRPPTDWQEWLNEVAEVQFTNEDNADPPTEPEGG